MDDAMTDRAVTPVGEDAPRVIRIEISSDHPFVGSVVDAGATDGVGFEGWLGFLRAISQTLDGDGKHDDTQDDTRGRGDRGAEI